MVDGLARTYFLDQTFLIDPRCYLLEVDRALDRLPEASHKLYVDVCFEERRTYLFDHAIESLRRTIVLSVINS